ncbi:spore germination protein [Tissierella creatinophila]|uniref:Spore germination protein B1 n=1 Tax=Tissierella creatinophila DSM 6911 TaxID=1123403 RepID=A0A1U7M4N0_TISCR|nr:spore germination protein [Tissierella creatinophila]OLS02274.1 spore germination protein B1 [Tissierella creatinophila DSM 6911]
MIKTVSKDIDENLKYIKEVLKGSSDLVIREFEIGDVFRIKMATIYIDGLSSKEFVSQFAIGSLFKEEELKSFTLEGYKTSILDAIKKDGLSAADISEKEDFEEIITDILSGETILFINHSTKAIKIATKEFPARGIDEPKTESLVRGPREGFVESLRFNTALVRRRIRDKGLNIEMYQIGKRSKTDIALLFIEDIVDPKFLIEVRKRLDAIDIDAIIDSSTLEYLIEDNYLSPFPQIENTERPDSVSASLYEGRVSLIVDGSPFVLVLPATIGTLLNSSEDYYSRWIEASAKRILRLISVVLILFPSALYVAITVYHPSILPTKLSYYLAASRINVPFPALVEAIMMESTMELLRESGTRLSGPIGTTIGIVGGLIIGQAAVEAGIVSPLMIIIVAISSIATFAVPSYELSTALRLFKFILIVCSGVLGLFGLMLGVILTGTHILSLNSFGIPFSSPYSGLGIEEGDLKDTFVKAPLKRLWLRPGFTFPKNKKRMKEGKKHEK